MKQTFLPIVFLLAVTLTLVAWLYFSDVEGNCCEKNPPAKRVKTGLIYSSMGLVDVTTPVRFAAARIMT